MKKKLGIFAFALLVLASIGGTLAARDTDTFNPSEGASSRASSSHDLKIHYLDVGQADSIFIELPNEQTMLIDAGEDKNKEKVTKYIEDKGHNKIDYLVATHPHADHIGGMAYVVNNLEIGKVYMPKVTTNTKTYENLLIAINDKQLKINIAKAGVNIINRDDLKIDIIAPVSDKYDDLNNYSAVIKLMYKNKSFLFMGDAEELSEKEITEDVKSDVLKIGHHGSSTYTGKEFLEKVDPLYAVISAGEGNSYGHPHKETLEKLNKKNINVYRTDLNGTITITSNGESISADLEVDK